MKIVLLNANPAVSRLATLALNKMGYEYVEIGDVSELEGVFDVLIIDSDIDVKETNLKEFANKILYLSSKHSPTFENADRILPKPFLPTEFITIVEYLAGKVRDAEDSGKVSVSGFEFMSDPVEDILKEEMMKTETDEFALDNELGEFLQDSAPQSKESAFDELNEIVKAIDDMDESSESLQEDDLNLDDLIDEVVKFDEPDEFEIDAKEEKFDDIEGILDAEDAGDQAEKFDAADELEDVKFETIDEPEDEENLTQDIFDEESAEDIFADFEQDVQEISEPEAAQNEPEIAHKLHPSEYGDIEQISEKDMALALNESGFEGGEAANLSSQKAQTTSKINELKAQISDAVAKNLENSLQDGELREALKNLNIKINISFEEK